MHPQARPDECEVTLKLKGSCGVLSDVTDMSISILKVLTILTPMNYGDAEKPCQARLTQYVQVKGKAKG